MSCVDMYFNWNVERQMFVSGKLMLTAEVTPAGKDKYCGAGYDYSEDEKWLEKWNCSVQMI